MKVTANSLPIVPRSLPFNSQVFDRTRKLIVLVSLASLPLVRADVHESQKTLWTIGAIELGSMLTLGIVIGILICTRKSTSEPEAAPHTERGRVSAPFDFKRISLSEALDMGSITLTSLDEEKEIGAGLNLSSIESGQIELREIPT